MLSLVMVTIKNDYSYLTKNIYWNPLKLHRVKINKCDMTQWITSKKSSSFIYYYIKQFDIAFIYIYIYIYSFTQFVAILVKLFQSLINYYHFFFFFNKQNIFFLLFLNLVITKQNNNWLNNNIKSYGLNRFQTFEQKFISSNSNDVIVTESWKFSNR